jgi:hypothetical protein
MPYAAIDNSDKAQLNRTDFVALWQMVAVYNAITTLDERSHCGSPISTC